MNKIRFIGDIHGKNSSYLDIVKSSPYPTVQVGDYGCGFRVNPISSLQPINSEIHRFIRGNHDNPSLCRVQANYIPDGTIENRILYVGGAGSIDRMYRTEELDWWADEQLSIKELNGILDSCHREQPEIIISHECPEFIADVICNLRGFHKYQDDNRTRMMLQQIYYLDPEYKPDLHIFGHWHVDAEIMYNGTRFICLNELSYIDIELDNPFEGEIIKYHQTQSMEFCYKG